MNALISLVEYKMGILKMLRLSDRRSMRTRQLLMLVIAVTGLVAGYFVSVGSVSATAQSRESGASIKGMASLDRKSVV